MLHRPENGFFKPKHVAYCALEIHL